MKKRILLTALLLSPMMLTISANAAEVIVPEGSLISGKTADKGAAYYISSGDSLVVNNSTFENNMATMGGAIYTEAKTQITGSTFINNEATSYWGGGAIKIDVTNDIANNPVIITNSKFIGNKAFELGADSGAISIRSGNVNIDNVIFSKNKSYYTGAIYVYRPANEVNISNSTFDANECFGGGAVANFGKNNAMTISNSIFTNNKATATDEDGAGALFLGAESKTIVNDCLFENNYSAAVGGAIATRAEGQGANTVAKLDIYNTKFVNNEATSHGGAIYNAFYNSIANPQNIAVKNVVFEGNKSGGHGGAIYNASKDLAGQTSSIYITDSSFVNNTAAGEGGAIYANGTVNIEAKDSNVVFSNNTSASGKNDIYMAGVDSELNIKVADGKAVTFDGGIDGNSYIININSNPVTYAMLRAGSTQNYSGSVVVNSAIKNATINVSSGEFHLAEGSSLVDSTVTMGDGTTLNTINGAIDDFGSSIELGNDVTLAVDVYMGDGSADKISDLANVSTVTVEEINPIGNTTSDNLNFNLAEALGVDPTKLSVSQELQQTSQTVLTPIRYLTGTVDAQGNVSFAPRGNSYKDFNPAVMSSSVAAQLGGLFTQYNSYNQAFMNMDMRMNMSQRERRVLRMRNSIASAGTAQALYSPINKPEQNNGAWMRGYSTFESVNMDAGPKVNNVMYGTFFGGDSEMYQLENGAEVQYSVYAGYNGSHQTYSGNSMWQNGGTMGISSAYYKNNFFTALTANVGASVVDTTTMFGKEDFSMLMAGIASKTGYNFEFNEGKFIIQPNYLMSYSFVNTFDYTNAAGVRINSDPLNSIQIAPGVKFIGNLNNGWQPYASVRMVWNLMDKTDFTAANTSLPEISVKPYVEYGVGVQKRWGEKFTGFAQTMLRNGGRTGISLMLGFRLGIGKCPEKCKHVENLSQKLPKAKTVIASLK